MNFKQISYEERLIIEHLYNKQNKGVVEIAKELNRNKGSISREIKLGLVSLLTTQLENYVEYSALKAQKKRNQNSKNRGSEIKIINRTDIKDFIDNEIKIKNSPEVISFKLKTDHNFKLCFKTIYNYIDKKVLKSKRLNLICGNYRVKRNKKEETERSRKMKIGRMISDRPQEIETRENIGHWEMDLVEGVKGGKVLLVLSERKTRKEIIRLLENKTSEQVVSALNSIEKNIGFTEFINTFQTITSDNGREFTNFEEIEKSITGEKRTSLYYANAYSSWQRGTNENINKMIRRWLPKKTSFDKLTNDDIKKIEDYINNYPRKMFNFKSSNEVYSGELKKSS